MARILITLHLLVGMAGIAHAASGKKLGVDLEDGVTLSATYFAASEPGPAILLLNMCDPSRDRSDWIDVASRVADRGYHVMTFDYRGFGDSGGEMPAGLRTVDEAMPFWRANWMGDIQAVYETLTAQAGVTTDSVGVAGASCGVFMGLEFALDHPNVRSFASLGGPTDTLQHNRLRTRSDLPVLIIGGNEGPIHEWSDALFAATENSDSRMIKYNAETYGTKIFDYEPGPADMLVQWITDTIAR